jgi:hypothetical protein
MWLCSASQIDSKPRSSRATPSSTGLIAYEVGKKQAPKYTGRFFLSRVGIWVSGCLGGLSGPADDNSGLASLEGAPGGKLVRGGHALGSRAETWSSTLFHGHA